jgi:lipopolysaccharide transport system ATP-binding protein
MISDIVIKAENLSKKYIIGHKSATDSYATLRDVLMNNAKNLWNKTRDLVKGKPVIYGDTLEEVWALKDVSFEIHQGEAVGIIGRNGAGKSTLLKILSRITEPSTGRVAIKGRVASLLEVGTGFHPELTGRENIYLNGTILGMTRQEIKRKFDEIVDFAEIEKYLDTPVKRYSSGMYVRLAFAVAAHLEPEILVVDEVLAVGDATFQKKCLGKMEDVAKRQGRTVLFVSHNMAAVSHLCSSGFRLEDGRLTGAGEPNHIIEEYLSSGNKGGNKYDVIDLTHHKNRICNGVHVIKSITIKGYKARPLVTGQPAIVTIRFDRQKINSHPELAFTVETLLGQRIFSFATYWTKRTPETDFAEGVASCLIQKLPLSPGVYTINVAIGTNDDPFRDHIPNAYQFEVMSSDYYGTGKIPESNHGVVFIDASWHDKDQMAIE